MSGELWHFDLVLLSLFLGLMMELGIEASMEWFPLFGAWWERFLMS